MEALPPVLSRDKTMEVLLESLFLPLPVYPASSLGDHEASTIQMASTRIPAEDALRHSDRQIRIASRTCSFMKLLTEKINWRLGDLRLYLPKTATRQLAAKRKHEEMMLHEPQENTLTYIRRRQLIFISQAIRDYTNDGPGQNSFQLEDAENTALRIWTYLTRHFAKGEINFMIDTALSHLHLLMKSATPCLMSSMEQSQPSMAPGQGQSYFPPHLGLPEDKHLDLQYFDLQALRRASTIYRVQQLLKISHSTQGGESPVTNGWRFQQQAQHLDSLPYDKHLQALLPHLPDYQDQLRENLVMYRQWLLRDITEEETAWARDTLLESAVSRGELRELFEHALLKQVNHTLQASAESPRRVDSTPNFQNSMALRFYQIINPLHDDVYEEYKPFAIVYKMLTPPNRQRARSLHRTLSHERHQSFLRLFEP